MSTRRVLGPAVRAIRESKGIRGSQLATKIPMSHAYLVNIEKGVKQPAADKAEAIAQALGVDITAITYEIPECPTCSKQQAA